MSARDWIEFDGKPGTSGTDIIASVVVMLMLASMLGLIVLVAARTI